MAIVSPSLLALLLASRAASAPAVSAPTGSGSVTISDPGISNHGDPNLLCFPTKATDVLLFFLTNYLAHAVTVKVPAAVQTTEAMARTLFGLLFPVSGVVNAVQTIFGWSWKLSPKFPFVTMDADSLETALNARALVVAMRTPVWKPAASDGMLRDLRRVKKNISVLGRWIRAARRWAGKDVGPEASPQEEGPDRRKVFKYITTTLPHYPEKDEYQRFFGMPNVHGGFELPEGYEWIRLNRNAIVRPYGRPINENQPASSTTVRVRLSTSFSTAQPLIAIFQTVNAAWTLYKTQGDQLDQFGFTAFGLTVTPYLMMSIINFIAQLATPQYTSAYIVYSEVLAEAAARVGNPRVVGIVGEVVPDSSTSSDKYLDGWVSEGKDGVNVVLQTDDRPAEEQKRGPAEEQKRGPAEEQNRGMTATTTPTHGAKEGVESSSHVVQEATPEVGEQVEEFLVPTHPRFELHEAPKYGIWRRLMPRDQQNEIYPAIVIALFVACIPVAVIAGISKFRPGQSTRAQRGVIIAWIVCSAASELVLYGLVEGIAIASVVFVAVLYALFWGRVLPFDIDKAVTYMIRSYLVLMAVGSAIPLAMFVTVGQQLMQYGSCQSLG